MSKLAGETVSGTEPTEPRASAVPRRERRVDGQFTDHWVLPASERAKGFIRPLRVTYLHLKCQGATSMPQSCAETYARRPVFYSSTFCCHCKDYFPVGPAGEFVWYGTQEKVGS